MNKIKKSIVCHHLGYIDEDQLIMNIRNATFNAPRVKLLHRLKKDFFKRALLISMIIVVFILIK